MIMLLAEAAEEFQLKDVFNGGTADPVLREAVEKAGPAHLVALDVVRVENQEALAGEATQRG